MKAQTKKFALAIACALLGACAQVPKVNPEITLHNVEPAQVRDRLVEQLAAKQARITTATDSMVVAERELEGGKAIAAQLLIGNAYSSTPEATVTFVIVKPEPDTVRVFGSGAISTQMAFGQIQTVDATDANIQTFLNTIKTSFGQ